MAESQYAGRGQQQSGWHAQPGKNLTFSLLLNPVFLPVLKQFELNMAVSLGVHFALKKHLGSRLKIKWPNDVYYDSLKLGGILIENILQGDTIKHAVIGIGINVNQTEFPPHLPNPVSVKQILHTDYALRQLLAEICSHIEAWYLKLKGGHFEKVYALYCENLYRLNETRLFKSDNNIVEGFIKGVTPAGRLVVQTKTAELTFDLKQIEFLNTV